MSPFDHLIAKASQLYSLPSVAIQVLELTNNPQVDVPALKACIENDPALTTKVLRVVNSSLFGLSREVSDLNQALALLGIKPLKLLVLGFSLPQRLFDGVAAGILGRYWRHTLTKAVAAREISETLFRRPGDEAFIAGLLQDLGILLLIQEVGNPYGQFFEKVQAQGVDLRRLETDVMGFDHTMLSARLLAHWKLPEVLVGAVCSRAASEGGTGPALGAGRAFGAGLPTSPEGGSAWAGSGNPPTAPGDPRTVPVRGRETLAQLVETLELAELLAQLLADGQTDVLGPLLAAVRESHGLSRDQLEGLLSDLEEKVAQLAEVLSLRLPEGRDYQQIVAEAHLRLAEVAAEAAGDLLRDGSRRQPAESKRPAPADEFRTLSEAVARITRRSPGACAADRALPADRRTEPLAAPSDPRPTACSPDSAPATSGDAACAGRPLGAVGGLSRLAAEADPGMLGRLAASVSACRKSHCPLTLLLVELDDVDELMITCGVDGLRRIRSSTEDACRAVEHPSAACLAHREMGFAVILPDCDRRTAVQLANRLIDRVRRHTRGSPSLGRSAPGVSVGAATLSVPTKNFPAQDLLDGAERCLYGSHASGGVVKSIEIY